MRFHYLFEFIIVFLAVIVLIHVAINYRHAKANPIDTCWQQKVDGDWEEIPCQ